MSTAVFWSSFAAPRGGARFTRWGEEGASGAWREPEDFSMIEGLLKGSGKRKPLIRHGLLTMVDVAQLVEPRVVIPAVVGSSPIVHPTSPVGQHPGR